MWISIIVRFIVDDDDDDDGRKEKKRYRTRQAESVSFLFDIERPSVYD